MESIRDKSLVIKMKEKIVILIVLIRAIIASIVIVVSISCIYKPSTKRHYLVIFVSNLSDKPENITVAVFDSSSIEIFNVTILLKNGEDYTLRNITEKEGKYSIHVSVDENRSAVNDKIELFQVKKRLSQISL
ncbi:MAG: hypothetical protein AB1779_04695 [Candidatus Thermoplasmatota archaeon]